MAENPEALAQLARLLGEPGQPLSRDDAHLAVEQRFDALVEGLTFEAAASDDVYDRASALDYLEARLAFLSSLLSKEQVARLQRALKDKIEQW